MHVPPSIPDDPRLRVITILDAHAADRHVRVLRLPDGRSASGTSGSGRLTGDLETGCGSVLLSATVVEAAAHEEEPGGHDPRRPPVELVGASHTRASRALGVRTGLTGMPMHYADAFWGQAVLALWQGERGRGGRPQVGGGPASSDLQRCTWSGCSWHG